MKTSLIGLLLLAATSMCLAKAGVSGDLAAMNPSIQFGTESVGPQYSDIRGQLEFTGSGSYTIGRTTSSLNSVGVVNRAAVASGDYFVTISLDDDSSVQIVAMFGFFPSIPAGATRTISSSEPTEPLANGTYTLRIIIWENEGRLTDTLCVEGYCVDYILTEPRRLNVNNGVFTWIDSTSVTPQPGMWWNPAESGSGYNIEVDHGVVVMTTYSYNTDGSPQWYLSSGTIIGSVATLTLDKYRNGQCITCTYAGRPAAAGNAGTISLRFTSSTSGYLTRPNGVVVPIEKFRY